MSWYRYTGLDVYVLGHEHSICHAITYTDHLEPTDVHQVIQAVG